MILFSDDHFERETIRSTIKELQGFSFTVFNLLDLEVENISETNRRRVAVFCMGALQSIARSERLNQPQTYAITIEILLNIFKYSEQKAIGLANDLNAASSIPELRAISEKGVVGYHQYVERKDEHLRRNAIEVLFNHGHLQYSV
ncbi:MAG: Imm48 family immunity protein [Bacillus sp. (in: firmicutes)]